MDDIKKRLTEEILTEEGTTWLDEPPSADETDAAKAYLEEKQYDFLRCGLSEWSDIADRLLLAVACIRRVGQTTGHVRPVKEWSKDLLGFTEDFAVIAMEQFDRQIQGKKPDVMRLSICALGALGLAFKVVEALETGTDV